MLHSPAPVPAGAPVLAGQQCPYCGGKTEYINSTEIFGSDYGMIYCCRPCQAWVGVHQGTAQALGSLANAELRGLRMLAHRWFDPIAVEGLINDFYPVYMGGVSVRAKAYHWLAGELGIKNDYCHIAMFNEEECRKVIALCQPIVESLDGSGDIY